ncbi:tRNA 5-methylaminomethyl-2-thiouridine biosynthesis bifunctional protein MnmC [Enhygromyxa salina]|uniref:tRNA 5-methylaminomethyl-2-thiouridine biosynthesis bifunctional protein MnmC n=2 Tax=Enhygromyxa salina TaxID=215803 RepID=A0A2S9XDF9_9BACT|nr:FAD/NAD(P)-binding protein [Enhygromyxa salina]PRP90721.1 tRNA 5-methylaminomethyl-2-thiouridine biosynthesis bifunctional protein MnmC [Enhygromyxa salina]
MLDWLIIGAGVHGLHVAASLRRRGSTLRLLDPHPRPLAEWDRRAEALAMTHLRSPLDQDLDVEQLSLHHFAEAQPRPEPGMFAGPCRAPSLELFRRHVKWIRARLGLDPLLERGTATGLELVEGGVRVESDRGGLVARRVILALGHPPPSVPAWADPLGGAALHVFDPRFDRSPPSGSAVIVGGGLSAAQLALHWARARPGAPTLICRRAPPIAELDAASRWARPRWSWRFASFPLAGRLSVLDAETRRGSVPPRVAARLARAQRRGSLRIVFDEVVDVRREAAEQVVTLGDHPALRCRRLALATGFAPAFDRVPLLDGIAEELGLERGPLALPLLDAGLRWHPRVHVVGAAARLSLGPLAANIAGARLAALRLAAP